MQITDLAMNIVKLNRGDVLDDETIEQTVIDLKFLALMASTDKVREHYEAIAEAIEARNWDKLHEINEVVIDNYNGRLGNCEDAIYETAFEECNRYLGNRKAVMDLTTQALFDAEMLLFYFDGEEGVGCFYHFDDDGGGTICVTKVEKGRDPESFSRTEIEDNRKAMQEWFDLHKETLTHIVMLVYSPNMIRVKVALSSIIGRR